MSDEAIKPALTAEHWQQLGAHDFLRGSLGFRRTTDNVFEVSDTQELLETIAVANDALWAHDPHKITRADVTLLRILGEMRSSLDENTCGDIRTLAAKLESLLRPS